jgi:hypothetical protein
MNYLNEYDPNDRFKSFQNITTSLRNNFQNHFDAEEEVALRMMQLREQEPRSYEGLRVPNLQELSGNMMPMNLDSNVNEHVYMLEREAVEEEMRAQNPNGAEEATPMYMKMDPRDKLKILEGLNTLIMNQKVFLTRSRKDTYEGLLQFFKEFNNFSSLYQSFADKIKRDVNAKQEIERKLIELEGGLENGKFLFNQYDLNKEPYKLDTGKQKFLNNTYELETVKQLYNDALAIVKEMINGQPIHAFLTNYDNVQYGQVSMNPEGLQNDRNKSAEDLAREAEEARRLDAEKARKRDERLRRRDEEGKRREDEDKRKRDEERMKAEREGDVALRKRVDSGIAYYGRSIAPVVEALKDGSYDDSKVEEDISEVEMYVTSAYPDMLASAELIKDVSMKPNLEDYKVPAYYVMLLKAIRAYKERVVQKKREGG